MNNKKYFLPLVFALLVIAGILIGNWYGTRTVSGDIDFESILRRGAGGKPVNFSLSPKNQKLTSVLSYIENEYVDAVNIDTLTEAAIPTIIEKLDPHSVYIPARELITYNEPLMGNFSGIGIQFNMNDDTVAVINTIPNGPSEVVGLLAGDRIIKVDDVLVAGMKLETDSIVRMLRGVKGTTVKVAVYRKGEAKLLDFVITRDDIPLHSVDVAYMLSETIGYIKISSFSQTTFKEFVEAVSRLHGEGMKKVILDLRGNGGGVMEAATNIADQFLEAGKLIVYTEGKARPRFDVYSTARGLCNNDEVVILIDELSASASEILAGAIQDNDRGTIIGRRSFGKGLVQEQIEFRDGSALRLTIARYYTPTGRSIQKPYNGNHSDYYHDLNERFVKGEFESRDSIKFADSLRYVTPGGKTVYGGGGIMPDVFVPIDTANVTGYFNTVRNLGLIYRFAFDYTDTNRARLETLKTAEEIDQYLNKSGYFNEFVNYAEFRGVKADWGEIAISRDIIATQLKAYIARNLIDNEGFFPIIRKIDSTLEKAVELISEK
jgi:carboxyl-terminal processing protease